MKKFIWMIFTMTGCVSVYVPNARNSPLFTKAGEVQGSIGFGNGLDLQGAVSITNHLGLMANYSYEDRDSQYDTNDDDDYHYHNFFEGGIGYYENQGIWCYEIFAGYGRGEGASYTDYEWWGIQYTKATGKYDRYFIQPAFGLNKKIVHVSFAPRISIVDFKEFVTDVSTFEVDDNPKIFFEPAVLGKVNLMRNRFFLAFQLGVSIPAATSVFYEYRPIQFSTGLGFRFGSIGGEESSEGQ